MRDQRRLGNSDIEISPIGLGTWQFSEATGMAGRFWGALGPDETSAIVRAALDHGISWFDTAEIYGNGRSERGLARGLLAAGKRDGDVVVATKWWPTLRTAAHLERTIGERAACLDPFGIDLHQVHQPLSLSPVKSEMDAMARLVRAGKIRSVGVSNYSAAGMRRAHEALAAHGLGLASNQVRYSLLDRRIETNGVLETARRLGITIIAYSPLAQGLLSGKFHDRPEAVRERPGPRRWLPGFRGRGLERSRPVIEALRRISGRLDATPSQVALAWLIRMHGDTVTAIPGATRPGHAEEAAGAMRVELASDDLRRLDEVSRPFR
jgi:aryl-alcohol dehydrogenase-like predicted oxidoreductase